MTASYSPGDLIAYTDPSGPFLSRFSSPTVVSNVFYEESRLYLVGSRIETPSRWQSFPTWYLLIGPSMVGWTPEDFLKDKSELIQTRTTGT